MDVGQRGRDHRRRAEWLGPSAKRRCPIDDRVDLRLVAVVVAEWSSSDRRARSPAAVGPSARPGTCRAGCTPTPRSAPSPRCRPCMTMPRIAVALARQMGNLGVEQQRAARRLERTLAATSAPSRCRRPATDAADVAQGVRQGAETRAGQLGRDAPHHRSGDHRRATQCFGGEEAAHHVGSAAPAPPQQRGRAATATGEHLAGRSSSAIGGSLALSSTIRTAGIAAFRYRR